MPCTRKSTSPIFAASSSKTSTKRLPMILRFFSGSVTPFASAERNRSDRVDRDQLDPKRLPEERLDLLPARSFASCRGRRRCTSAGRRSRDGPGPRQPTNRRRPRARRPHALPPTCSRIAAQIASPRRTPCRPTRLRSRRCRCTKFSRMRARRPRCARPRDGTARPRSRRCRPPAPPRRAIRPLLAMTLMPGGSSRTRSPWLIHTTCPTRRRALRRAGPRVRS